MPGNFFNANSGGGGGGNVTHRTNVPIVCEKYKNIQKNLDNNKYELKSIISHTKPNIVNLDSGNILMIDIQSNNGAQCDSKIVAECPMSKLKKHFRHFVFRNRDRCTNTARRPKCRYKAEKVDFR